jgi:parallel beta-helix repeat protein
VTITDNIITDNRLIGVRVRMGAADIINNTIVHTQPPYGRGIHITNTTGWPASRIIGNLIADNAYIGIGTNMAGRVIIADNTVTGNGQRGIAVFEMSDAVVANNTVRDNGGNGIHISDNSMVTACNNTVTNSLPTITDSVRYGNGITIDFGSEVELYNNTITGNANYGISIMESSSVTLGANDVRDNGADAVWLDDTSGAVGSTAASDSCS